jgi:hypothetical protein
MTESCHVSRTEIAARGHPLSATVESRSVWLISGIFATPEIDKVHWECRVTDMLGWMGYIVCIGHDLTVKDGPVNSTSGRCRCVKQHFVIFSPCYRSARQDSGGLARCGSCDASLDAYLGMVFRLDPRTTGRSRSSSPNRRTYVIVAPLCDSVAGSSTFAAAHLKCHSRPKGA